MAADDSAHAADQAEPAMARLADHEVAQRQDAGDTDDQGRQEDPPLSASEAAKNEQRRDAQQGRGREGQTVTAITSRRTDHAPAYLMAQAPSVNRTWA